jgi:hypothetical protein
VLINSTRGYSPAWSKGVSSNIWQDLVVSMLAVGGFPLDRTYALAGGLDESGLVLFLADPKIPPDTNGVERALRGVAVGRKNHYGSRSEPGTRVAALFYSLIESAKLAGVGPRGYLGRGGPSGDQSLETRSGEVVISARSDAQR